MASGHDRRMKSTSLAVGSDVLEAKLPRPGPYEAKAINPEAKAFMHTTGAEIKIRSTSNSLNFYCFCIDIQFY